MHRVDAALLGELAQGGRAELIAALAPALDRRLAGAGIHSPLRLAHFLAQGCYETWFFSRLEENLGYSAARIARVWPRLDARAALLAGRPEALANAAYAGANGNGDESSGDGWRYRGRGLFQLTGRANYALAGALDDPDSAAAPDGAVASALAFWRARRIGEAADDDDIPRVTRLVNGGALGISGRAILTRRALGLLES